MYDISSSNIDKLIIHKVGNKLRADNLTLSESLTPSSNDINDLLLRNYLKPIIIKNNSYEFFHDSDINLNEIFHFSNEIFKNRELFIENSRNIAKSLYNASTHPNISSGELIIVLYNNIKIEENLHFAIGLYKTEIKENYLEIEQKNEQLTINNKTGISVNKLQKAALILDNNEVFAIDTLSQKTKYWFNDFLQIRMRKTPNNNASIANKILQKVFTEIKKPDEAIKLTNELSDKINSEENLKIEDLRDISKKYINENSFDEIIEKVSTKEDISIELTDDINSEYLQKLNKRKKQKIKIVKDIELMISSSSFTIHDMKLMESNHGTQVSFTILDQ